MTALLAHLTPGDASAVAALCVLAFLLGLGWMRSHTTKR